MTPKGKEGRAASGRRRGPRQGAVESTNAPRRLQRMGSVTVGVVLPKSWIGERGLTPGCAVEVRTLRDGALLVRAPEPEGVRDTCTIGVPANTPPEHLFRQLVAAYLGGATEVVLVEPGGVTSETRSIARVFGRRTVQPEVVSDAGDVLILRDISAGPELELPLLLRRMYQLVHEMQKTAGEFLDRDRLADLGSLSQRDDEVDRQAWLVERTLVLRLDPRRLGEGDPIPRHDPVSPLLLARALERIGDHAVTLGENAARLGECHVPEAVTSALRAYHRQALEYLASAFDAVEHPDVDRANDLIDTGEALLAAHATLTESFLVRDGAPELTPLASACLGLVLQSIDRTAAYAQDIAQVGLDRAIAARIETARPEAETSPSDDGRVPTPPAA
jgi:phosphate uptake regulator